MSKKKKSKLLKIISELKAEMEKNDAPNSNEIASPILYPMAANPYAYYPNQNLSDEAKKNMDQLRSVIYENIFNDVESVTEYFAGLDERISKFVSSSMKYFVKMDKKYSIRVESLSYYAKTKEFRIPIYVTYAEGGYCDFAVAIKKDKKTIKVKIDIHVPDNYCVMRVIGTFQV